MWAVTRVIDAMVEVMVGSVGWLDETTKSVKWMIGVLGVTQGNTIGRSDGHVVNNGMGVVAKEERVLGRIKRVRTVVCGAKETLAEGHVGWKADVEVSLVVIPDSPKAKILLDQVRVEKMVWNEIVVARDNKSVKEKLEKLLHGVKNSTA